MRKFKFNKYFSFNYLFPKISLIALITISINIVLSAIVPNYAFAESKTKIIHFDESSSQTQTQTINIPNLKSVSGVTTDTGKLSYTVDGSNITITAKDGDYTSRETYTDPQAESKVVGDTRRSASNSFSSTISYSSEGYTGTLTKNGGVTSFVAGGSYTPSQSRVVTDTRSSTNLNDVPSFLTYNQGGYTGTLNGQGVTSKSEETGFWGPDRTKPIRGWTENGVQYYEYEEKWFSNGIVTTYKQNYSGNVYTEATDTRYYNYEQAYSGTAYKAGTAYRNYKYAYNVTVTYSDNDKSTVTLDTIPGEYTSGQHFFISGTANDADIEDSLKVYYTISEDKNNDGKGDTDVAKHKNKYIIKFSSDSEAQHYSKAIRVNTTDFPTGIHGDNYYQVSVWAEDRAGEKSEIASTMVKLKFNSQPIIKLDPANNGKVYSGVNGFNQIKVIGTVQDTDKNDSLTVKYTINELATHKDRKVTTGEIISNGEEQSLSGTINVDDTIPEGNYTATVWAEDDKGGKSKDTQTLSFKVDKTSPTQTNNNPDKWMSSKDKPFDLTLDISDNEAGIQSIKLPDGKSTEYKTPFAKEQQLKYSIEDNGEYSFVITDAVGNSKIHTINVTHLDKTIPTITADPDKYGPTKQQIDVNFTINDSGSGVDTRQYILSEFNETPASDDPLWKYLPNTVNINEEGNWYLHTKIVDKAGNEFIKTFGPYVLRIDKSKPDVYVVIEDNKPSVPQGKTTLKVDITGIDDLSKPEELTVEVSTDLITWTPARNLGEGGKIETEVTIPKDTPIGKNVTVYARISDDIGNAGYGSDDIIYGKNLDVDDTGELNIGDEEKLGPYTWIYIGNNRFITKDSITSRGFGSNNTFDIKNNTNIAFYLDNEFLDKFPPALQAQFVDFEEYAWKNGDSNNEGLIKKSTYVGLLTESEAKSLFWLDNLPGVGLTLTRTPDTTNQIRVATAGKKIISQRVNDNANVHPVVKLKEGYTVRNGKVIKIGTNGQILDRLEKFDEKVNAISAVTSLNRLTSRVDNRIELAVVGDSGIELKAVVQGIDSSRFKYNDDRITIDVNGIISANIPDVITVYGYKDKNGDGVTTTGEMVAKFEIYKKDYFFEASSVD